MSMSRYCEIWKASNGKWYLDLADEEYGDWEDSTTYGPFPSEDGAYRHLRNFSNPGGFAVDDSGDLAPPKRSPNGSPVQKPGQSRSWGRWASVEEVTHRFMAKQAAHFQIPTQTSSSRKLKQQGLLPVDEFFGEVLPRPNRPVVMQGEFVQNRRGEVLYFVGLDGQGEAILAETEREFRRLKDDLEDMRLHHTTPEKRASKMPHNEALKVLQKEFSDWAPGDLADAASSVSPRMSGDAKKVQRRYQELVKGRRGAFIPDDPQDPYSWEAGYRGDEPELESSGSQVPPARDSLGNELD